MKAIVTGGAGFIGSHLVTHLIEQGNEVVVIDNLSTGRVQNIPRLASFIRRDINKLELPDLSDIEGAQVIFHLAARGSVPYSLQHPDKTHYHNATGTLSVLVAAKLCRIPRVVYASSSSVYGDATGGTRREGYEGRPLSPYAASKVAAEAYAMAADNAYGVQTVGLRFFNVFGPRQRSNSEYAAVIPRWARALSTGRPLLRYGSGEQSRDFTYVDNVITALMAAWSAPVRADTFNIGTGTSTTLNALADAMRRVWEKPDAPFLDMGERKGDVAYSRADIMRARLALGWAPHVSLEEGLEKLAQSVLT